MIRKLFLIALCLFNLKSLHAQQIDQVQGFFNRDGIHYVSLLSDNSLWWYSERKGWGPLSRTGLPEKKINFIEVYIERDPDTWGGRIVCVLEDNSIWWLAENKTWQQLKWGGLPAGKKIKNIKSFIKPNNGLHVAYSKMVVLLEDNSIWWTEEKEWKAVRQSGLPKQRNIHILRCYQKTSIFGPSESHYVALLDDNSLWELVDGGNWNEVVLEGLPADKSITQLDVYVKPNPVLKGRLLLATKNQTILVADNDKSLDKISMSGLPQGYELNLIKTFHKYPEGSPDSRILVLLGDGSLWWYKDGKSWKPVPMDGLPKH